jgi:hypothetical protein
VPPHFKTASAGFNDNRRLETSGRRTETEGDYEEESGSETSSYTTSLSESETGGGSSATSEMSGDCSEKIRSADRSSRGGGGQNAYTDLNESPSKRPFTYIPQK